MTKKDYELLADNIREFTTNHLNQTNARSVMMQFAGWLTGALKHDNKRFDAEIFLERCRIDYDKN